MANLTERIERVGERASEIRDHIMQSEGESIHWSAVTDLIEQVKELASICAELDRSLNTAYRMIYDITGG